MLDQVLSTFQVEPDFNLSVMQDKQTLFDITANILVKIKSVFEQVKPDVALVHGDTTTTFASPKRNLSERIYFVFVNRTFGAVIMRE